MSWGVLRWPHGSGSRDAGSLCNCPSGPARFLGLVSYDDRMCLDMGMSLDSIPNKWGNIHLGGSCRSRKAFRRSKAYVDRQEAWSRNHSGSTWESIPCETELQAAILYRAQTI